MTFDNNLWRLPTHECTHGATVRFPKKECARCLYVYANYAWKLNKQLRDKIEILESQLEELLD